MSQIKYKFVTREGANLYNRNRYVKIPEGIKTRDEIEKSIVEALPYLRRGEIQFDHNKKAFKLRGYA